MIVLIIYGIIGIILACAFLVVNEMFKYSEDDGIKHEFMAALAILVLWLPLLVMLGFGIAESLDERKNMKDKL